tara:strand:- start:532 stop:1425 length:894 start_codon:yes stop_codon:yes gene_type:complete
MTSKFINFIYYFYLNYIQKFLILSSKPYVSGDSFKKISDHIFDESEEMKISDIKENDLLFVQTEYLQNFIEEYLPNIKNYFILLTHNSSITINENHLKMLGDKELKWFASNLNISILKDKRIEVLPYGIKNRNNLLDGRLDAFNFNIPDHDNKKNKIYSSFNVLKNKDRVNILRISKESKIIDSKNYANRKRYIKDLSLYKYSICPSGEAVDTHRFWESLIVKTIPVVKKSDFIENLNRLNIPMLILENWEELYDINENDLSSLYETYLTQLKENNFIKLEFWLDLINQSKLNRNLP